MSSGRERQGEVCVAPGMYLGGDVGAVGMGGDVDRGECGFSCEGDAIIFCDGLFAKVCKLVYLVFV